MVGKIKGQERGERRGRKKEGSRREGAGIVKVGRAWYLELYIIKNMNALIFQLYIQCLVYMHGVCPTLAR